MTKRAKDYARFSTDLQNDRSVDDQHYDNAGHIKQKGYIHVGSGSDRAISGAFMMNRPGILQLIEDAKNGLYDVLVAEHPDRLSRSQADMATLFQQLRFYNVEIECLSGGILTSLSAGLYGMIGQEQREAIAPKVRRGHAAVLRDGRKPAGRAYGYDPTPGQPGVHRVNEEKAKIFRLIYDLYIAGVAPRVIAIRLNEMGVPPPRTAPRWIASTINGDPKKGTGILCNPAYIGMVTYDRNSYPKNPESGKRVRRSNPESQHKSNFVESMRIIDDDTFEMAQAVRKVRSSAGPRNTRTRKTVRLLSGLLRCSECGGGMSVGGKDSSGTRVRCSKRKESGGCSNGRQFYIHKLDSLVVEALQTVLSDKSLITEYVSRYQEEVERVCGASRRDRKNVDSDLLKCVRAKSVLVQKVANELLTDEEAAPVLKDLRDKITALQQRLMAADLSMASAQVNSRGLQRYRETIENLGAILKSANQSIDPKVISAFRELVGGVIVYPRDQRGPYTVRIAGHLNAVVSTKHASAIAMAERMGFEPTRSF